MSNLQLQFQIECKDTKPGEEVYLVGNANELGNWNAKNSQKLKTPFFSISISQLLKFLKESLSVTSYNNNIPWAPL